MSNDHIKQHYIPQFIIRKFCKSDGKLYYYNKKNKSIVVKSPNEIFEEKNLYKYKFGSKNDPNIIEKDLAEFERVASEIILPFRENYSVSLNYKNNELLKYFFFIMMFRSKFMTATYNQNIFEHNKKTNLTAEELDEFYKQNLGKLVRHRSLENAVLDKEIINNLLDMQLVLYMVLLVNILFYLKVVKKLIIY